ncbi:hypothetical protein CR513_56862, partial [Mucuna pruriens]
YLGSITQNDGEIKGDVNHGIQARKNFHTTIRSVMLYGSHGSECWIVKSQQDIELNVAKMRMLQ